MMKEFCFTDYVHNKNHLFHSFIRSFVPSFIHSFIHSFI